MGKAKAQAKPLVLFSAISSLAFRIAVKYYGGYQYVWCCPYPGGRNAPAGVVIPPSSDPYEIYYSYVREIEGGDLHGNTIKSNKTGIINGAIAEKAAGTITDTGMQEIMAIVGAAQLGDFWPMLLVIPFAGVASLVVPATIARTANPFSPEYIISRLPPSKFQIIDLKKQH